MSSDRVTFKDMTNVRYTAPIAMVGVSEVSTDNRTCWIHYNGKEILIPMAYAAMRKLLGEIDESFEHISFKDIKNIRYTIPRQMIGVSEVATDNRTCMIHYNGKEILIPMSYAAMRKLIGETANADETPSSIPIPIHRIGGDNGIGIHHANG